MAKSKERSEIILETQPTKARLLFMWAEIIIIEAILLTFWCLLETNFNKLLVAIVVIFLSLFAIIAALLTLLYIKHNRFYFTQQELVAKAGISEVFQNRIKYKDIVFYKKYTTLPDLLAKKGTASFLIYKIYTKKNGRKKLVKDAICSMHGVRHHQQISEIFEQKNVTKLQSYKQKSQLKKELKQEWKQIKQNQK